MIARRTAAASSSSWRSRAWSRCSRSSCSRSRAASSSSSPSKARIAVVELLLAASRSVLHRRRVARPKARPSNALQQLLYQRRLPLGHVSADRHPSRAVADRRAAVEVVTLAVLIGAPDHHPRRRRCRSGARPGGRADARTSADDRVAGASAGHAARSAGSTIAGVRCCVDDLAEAKLAEHDPRAEQRLRAVEAALDPVLAQVLARPPPPSRPRPAASTPPRPRAPLRVRLEPAVVAAPVAGRHVRERGDAAATARRFASGRALGGHAAVVFGHHAEHRRGEPARGGVGADLADVDGQDLRRRRSRPAPALRVCTASERTSRSKNATTTTSASPGLDHRDRAPEAGAALSSAAPPLTSSSSIVSHAA